MNKKFLVFITSLLLAIQIASATSLRTHRRAFSDAGSMLPQESVSFDEQIMQLYDVDPSYNPFSDQFKFHSLYQSGFLQTGLEGLGNDLSVFLSEDEKKHFTDPVLREELIKSIVSPDSTRNQYVYLLSKANVFKKLGLYTTLPEVSDYKEYILFKNKNYCDEADMLNLIDPTNLFEHYKVTDSYPELKFQTMMKEVADDAHIKLQREELPDRLEELILRPDSNIQMTKGMTYDTLRSIGMNHTCITQSYSSITGGLKLSNKKLMADYIGEYKSKNIPKTCLDYEHLFPVSYRLHDLQECNTFFGIIHSTEYAEAKAAYPIQYLTKSSGVHQGKGVEILTQENEDALKTTYGDGALCGQVTEPLIAQKYLSNPLLIYNNQKFDFRVYTLVASTNPLIAFWQDGFVRVSLSSFDPQSKEKSNHLTNSHLSDSIIEAAETEEEKEMLRNMQLSTFEMLASDLAKKGRFAPLSEEEGKQQFLTDLKSKMKTAIAQVLRMSYHVFEQRSGGFRLMGIDFMLDNDMNLWFVEANTGPQGSQNEQKRNQFAENMYRDALEIEFAFLRSRVTRVREFVRKATEEYRQNGENWNKEQLVAMFQEANKEKLESDFEISNTNKWEKIIDLTIEGTEEAKYLGNLDSSCFF